MTYHEAIRRLFDTDPRERTTAEVVAELRSRWPGTIWRVSSVRTILIALSVNHSSRHHYPSYERHAFLCRAGRGRYRPWDDDRDDPNALRSVSDPTSASFASASRSSAARPHSQSRATYRDHAEPWHVMPGHVLLPAPHDERASSVRHDLIRALVAQLHTEPFQAHHRRRSIGHIVTGWPERLERYFWPTPSDDLAATEHAIAPWFERAGTLAAILDCGGTWSADERDEVTQLADGMLDWGRVPQRNGVTPNLVQAVVQRALGRRVEPEPPMNSGWTKVAALATAFLEGHGERHPHVIWDSRVSTSLISRLDTLMVNAGEDDPSGLFPGIGTVPGRGGTRATAPLTTRLHLRWPNGYGSWRTQDAGSVLVREIRDVLNTDGYPCMPARDGASLLWTIRGVESVLFMDGY